MCCRYYMEESPELRPFVDAVRGVALTERMTAELGKPLITAGEIRPTNIAPVIASGRSGKKAAFPMVWGFTGRTSCLFNARVESADIKPMWRESWEKRRCIVPASWYFEWEHLTGPGGRKKTGDKYAIRPKGTPLTLMAGLYRFEEGFPHFCILTRDSAEGIRFIHDRMPVILDAESAREWIRPSAAPDAIRRIAGEALDEMVFEPQRSAPLL